MNKHMIKLIYSMLGQAVIDHDITNLSSDYMIKFTNGISLIVDKELKNNMLASDIIELLIDDYCRRGYGNRIEAKCAIFNINIDIIKEVV